MNINKIDNLSFQQLHKANLPIENVEKYCQDTKQYGNNPVIFNYENEYDVFVAQREKDMDAINAYYNYMAAKSYLNQATNKLENYLFNSVSIDDDIIQHYLSQNNKENLIDYNV